MDKPLYVSVSGGIAVGKTTLASRLASILTDCQVFIEHPGRNPYLADFYTDMQRWAFHSRVAMLAMFASHYKDFDTKKRVILLDRSLHELICFANLHLDRGNLDAREFSTYQMLYDGYISLAPRLDLVIYLSCSPQVALQRIEHRDRAFERGVSANYLTEVDQYYEQWLAGLPANTALRRYNTDSGIDPTTVATDIQGYLPQ
jgi:deoxyadenosine/deoxycytidine kinase